MSNSGLSHKTVKGNTHTWTLRGVQFTDSGTYIVEAKNAHGTARAYCSVKVCVCVSVCACLLYCNLFFQ